MNAIRWHRLFTRENLGKFSKWASVAIFLCMCGISTAGWLSWVALVLLESYFAFASVYFWRQRQYLMCAVFAVLFVALPAGVLYLNLYGVERGIVVRIGPDKR